MAQNPSNLPHFNITPSAEEKTAADFLLRKFMARKRKNPQHYLVQPIPYKALKFIKNNAKKYPYFLKFDIRLYYPSISHQILIRVLLEIYQNILKASPSRRFKKCLKNGISEFLAKSPLGKEAHRLPTVFCSGQLSSKFGLGNSLPLFASERRLFDFL